MEKYLKGQCTANENEIVEQWLNSFDEFSTYKMSDLKDFEKDQIRSRVFNNVISQSSRPYSLKPYLLAAVISLIFIMAGALFYLNLNSDDSGVALLTKNTKDYRARFTLPDSSVVWLNQNSKLTYPETFRDDIRTVYLSGEAFFDVKENKEKPFIVISNNVSTKVLGTTFNINAYEKSDEIKVSVLTGEVTVSKVSANGNELLGRLQADMKLSYNASSDSSLVLKSETNEDIKWQKQQLIFRNSSLRDIANTIENWYEVKVKITNNRAAACTFTANFEATTELKELLDMLQLASGLTYKIDKKQVSIDGNECK